MTFLILKSKAATIDRGGFINPGFIL